MRFGWWRTRGERTSSEAQALPGSIQRLVSARPTYPLAPGLFVRSSRTRVWGWARVRRRRNPCTPVRLWGSGRPNSPRGGPGRGDRCRLRPRSGGPSPAGLVSSPVWSRRDAACTPRERRVNATCRGWLEGRATLPDTGPPIRSQETAGGRPMTTDVLAHPGMGTGMRLRAADASPPRAFFTLGASSRSCGFLSGTMKRVPDGGVAA